MITAILVNIALAAIVFSAVISMLVWAIFSSVSLDRRPRSRSQVPAQGVTRTVLGSLRQTS